MEKELKLIAKQQLEIESLKEIISESYDLTSQMYGMLYSIGAPLNDNVLGFNKDQIIWAIKLGQLVEALNKINNPSPNETS